MAPDVISDQALELTYRDMTNTLLEKSAGLFRRQAASEPAGSEAERFCTRRLRFIEAELTRRGVPLPMPTATGRLWK